MYSAAPPRCDTVRPNQRLWFGIGVLCAFCAVWFLFAFKPGERGLYPVCVFHRLTGLLCPGCGGLRALHHLLHAEFREAFHCNPLLMLLLPVAGWRSADSLIRAMRHRPPHKLISSAWIWTGLAVALCFGVLRNLDLPQLAWMRP